MIGILLLIDGHRSHALAFREAMITSRDGQFRVEWVETLSDGLGRLSEKGVVRAVFLNLFLPDSQGIETFDRLFLAAPGVPIVVLAGAADEDIAREALQRGAQDFLLEGHLDSYSFARALRNVIERKTTEEGLFVDKERAQLTLNSMGDAVLSTDTSGNVTYLNEVAEHLSGWSRKDASGRPFHEVLRIIDGSTHEPCRDPMELAMQQNKTVGLTANCILIRRDGREIEIEDCAAPIHDREGRIAGSVIVFHDVSAVRAIARQISHLAQHDVLTDLPNRMLLTDRITQAISLAHRNRRKLAVLFLDLDGFKQVNDALAGC